MSTLSITKSNPLNFMYNKWLQFGGEPKTPEDLCHFMRVCMFFWWIRWLISPEFYEKTPADRYHLNHEFRLPRIVIFGGELALIAFVTHLLNEGTFLYTTLRVLAGLVSGCVLIALSFGAVEVGRKANKNEAFGTFKAYLSARKQRICPFIEVEK